MYNHRVLGMAVQNGTTPNSKADIVPDTQQLGNVIHNTCSQFTMARVDDHIN